MEHGRLVLESVAESPSGATSVAQPVVKIRGDRACAFEDQVTVEEPLEIRLAGRSLSITMRTPGHDEELVAGLLAAERIVEGPFAEGNSEELGSREEDAVLQHAIEFEVRLELGFVEREPLLSYLLRIE
jgi:formate dehydrogenase assembly factor FdhD